MDYQARFSTPFAVLGIRCDSDRVSGIDFLPLGTPAQLPQNDLARRVCEAIKNYLNNPDQPTDLPFSASGTPFQQRVWQAISRIPPGKTLTYSELASQVGSGPRAVANACGANPIPLFVPCHRVVAANGLGGFMRGRQAGSLDIKRWLLAHERNASRNA